MRYSFSSSGTMLGTFSRYLRRRQHMPHVGHTSSHVLARTAQYCTAMLHWRLGHALQSSANCCKHTHLQLNAVSAGMEEFWTKTFGGPERVDMESTGHLRCRSCSRKRRSCVTPMRARSAGSSRLIRQPKASAPGVSACCSAHV